MVRLQRVNTWHIAYKLQSPLQEIIVLSNLTGVCYWINCVRLWSKTSGKTPSFSTVLNESSLMSHFPCQRPTHPSYCCSVQFAFLILIWDRPHLPVWRIKFVVKKQPKMVSGLRLIYCAQQFCLTFHAIGKKKKKSICFCYCDFLSEKYYKLKLRNYKPWTKQIIYVVNQPKVLKNLTKKKNSLHNSCNKGNELCKWHNQHNWTMV